MESDLVTTIIPVYNRAGMLREAVASVIAQTYRPIEIIVVDDGSTDRTPDAIADLTAAHPEIRSTRIANGGPGAAREAGRQLARGEFIQYLDSDDLLRPRRFERLVAALRSDPAADVAYGMTRYLDATGNEIAPTWKDPNQRQQMMFPSFLLGRWWDTPSPLYRRTVTDAAGPWMPLRMEEDWEYDARVAALGTKLVHVAEVFVDVRMGVAGHLSGDPTRLADRARAHELIASHAQRAGIARDSAEMQHFGRELFHLARQCGEFGLADDGRRLLALARSISADRDMQIYGFVARVIGWRRAGKLARMRERLR